MRRSGKRVLAAFAGALCLVIGLASVAYAGRSAAQPEQAPFELKTKFGWKGAGKGFIRGDDRPDKPGKNGAPHVALAFISGKSNTPMETLLQELKSGKTLEEIAAAHNVAWSEVESMLSSKEMSAERLQEAIKDTTEQRDRLTERRAEFESKLPEFESRIAKIEDESMRNFAKRHLELMKQRWELEGSHLSIMEKRLNLLSDELDYAKSK